MKTRSFKAPLTSPVDEPVDMPDRRLEAAEAYVLTAEGLCVACGCFGPVHGVLIAGPYSTFGPDIRLEDHGVVDMPRVQSSPFLLTYLRERDAALTSAIAEVSGGRLHVDAQRGSHSEAYCVNHCAHCRARIGDQYLRRPGDAFHPPRELAGERIQGKRVAGPVTVVVDVLQYHQPLADWLSAQQLRAAPADARERA